MLIKDFYRIVSLNQIDQGKYLIKVFINENHDIFKGHFPGNPVMPGVSIMQIIKEVAEQITQCQLQMQTVSNVKFMALINPYVNPELQIDLELLDAEDVEVKVKGAVSFDRTIALKLSTSYKIVEQTIEVGI
ncbi:MAG: 3-hydroxyacyl-ACP dehydratase [Pedobacter sp.]|nr:MAG: 3-hydroxyacyl-ACP dehydratase [Pedobacter sp.]